MIEIIYKEEQKKTQGKEEFFRIPNNIRQIGEVKGHQKIYIEDYAYTFLKKISRNQEKGGKAAILFGEYHWQEGCGYLFIKSALEIQDLEVSPEHIVFSEKVWGQVYEESRKYFPEQDIVGWFVSLPGFNMQMNEILLKTHLNHFAGSDKTLFILEPGENEDAFFLYENNQLVRQPGYYIYYEKNELMQAYMIEMSQNKSIEETEKIPDRAVVDFRRAIKEKKEETKESETDARPMHKTRILGAGAAAAILVVGITFFNSYEKMEGTLGKITADTIQETESEPVSGDNVQQPLIPSVTPKAEPVETESAEEWLGTQTTGEMPEEPEKAPPAEEEKQEMEAQPESSGKDRGEENNPEEAETATSPGIMQEYIIQRGDTMTSICKNKYGTIERLEEICQMNGIAPEDIIYAGQKIMLPE
ncbi:MAG: LysM peptidoglycan-binding domain-containing protein [Oliverpabstia sp.]|nr:LysM peptidoglycan-binding domain-containing protein [Oliverpabstia sp.]